MARVLLVPYLDRGHVEPLIALGCELRRRGHDVAMFCAEEFADRAARSGIAVRTPRWWQPRSAVPPDVLRRAAEPGGRAEIVRHLFFGSVISMTQDVEEAAVDLDADLILADTFLPGGGLAAERLDLPWASFSGTPVPSLDSYQVYMEEAYWSCFDNGEARATLGLAPRPGNLLASVSPTLHLIPTTPVFAGATTLPEHVRLVGPLSTENAGDDAQRRDFHTWAHTLTDRPTPVLVTTSSVPPTRLGSAGSYQERYVRACLDGLAGDATTVVVTLPPELDATVFEPLPANVHLAGSTSHEALLPHVEVVVTHGGWGTVSRALRHGRPLVLVPSTNDQPPVAQRCQELGVGVVIAPHELTSARLRHAVLRMADEPAFGRRARELGGHFARVAPLATSVTHLESILPANKKVMSWAQ